MPRNPDGDRPMTDAERQARYRDGRAAGNRLSAPAVPSTIAAAARRWHDAVAVLLELQAQYAAWLDALPDNQKDSALAEGVQRKITGSPYSRACGTDCD